MNRLLVAASAVLFAGISTVLIASAAPHSANQPMHPAMESVSASSAPVLVELFTSEGCSSCPPADQLLTKLEKTQPSLIVLSEHVTYWNGIGWKDPFSSNDSTRRQADYVNRLHLDSSYTPQMVVNGRYEFVGSDAGAAAQAIQKAAANATTPVTISDLQTMQNKVSFAVETGAVAKDAQLLLVLAQDEGMQHVANGENGGRTLRHVQIARRIQQVAEVKSNAAYKGNVTVDLPQAIAGSGWHVVVFIQQGSGGPIVGAASHAV
jgi:hypothetical protein